MGLKNRNVVQQILLTLVTCGIYGIYWVYNMVKEAVAVYKLNDDPRLDIILSILVPPVGFYRIEKKFSIGCSKNGIEHTDRSIAYFILCLFLPLGWFITVSMIQSEFNKIESIVG